MFERDLGAWILPQPVVEHKWVDIPRLVWGKAPFGYKLEHPDDAVYKPIPLELEALEQAKKHLKRYGSRVVANWLTKQTGRYISHAGLLTRIKLEQSHRRKVRTYRRMAERLERALRQAEHYESFLHRKEKTKFFESDYYVSLMDNVKERNEHKQRIAGDGECVA